MRLLISKMRDYGRAADDVRELEKFSSDIDGLGIWDKGKLNKEHHPWSK